MGLTVCLELVSVSVSVYVNDDGDCDVAPSSVVSNKYEYSAVRNQIL